MRAGVPGAIRSAASAGLASTRPQTRRRYVGAYIIGVTAAGLVATGMQGS
jgi:hypothetical protein